VNRYNPFEAYVGSESIGDEIVIHGRTNMNRAFDGDIVAVELLPQDQWNTVKSSIVADDGTFYLSYFLCMSFDKLGIDL
jgi:exosome complex exonuclease DIS3/RRP44